MSYFAKLPKLTRFLDFGEPSYYSPAPDGSFALVADIDNSTAALSAGRYKAVNMTGAALVVALLNSVGRRETAVCFAGDGATGIVEADQADLAAAALRGVVNGARKAYGFAVRAGLVPVDRLRRNGAEISAARYVLPGGPEIAFLRGRGLDLAEHWVKNGKCRVADGPSLAVDEILEGLSCRWAPVPTGRGEIVTLLAKSREPDDDEAIKNLADSIDAIVDLSSPEACPIKASLLQPESLGLASALEAGLTGTDRVIPARLRIAAEMWLVRAARALDAPIGKVKIRDYLSAIPPHSDYLKFDGTLRMVIDCTPAMAGQIERILEDARLRGELFYGLARSAKAIMTCFVVGMGTGQHLHFVDGDRGGYSAASAQMKQQVRHTGAAGLY